MTRSNEAFWWSLFSAGGVLAALFMPVIIVVTGFALPFIHQADEESYERLHQMLSSWLGWIFLVGLITMTFFHCAHRIRHTLMDLGLRHATKLLAVVCYGGAVAGSVVAGVILSGL